MISLSNRINAAYAAASVEKPSEIIDGQDRLTAIRAWEPTDVEFGRALQAPTGPLPTWPPEDSEADWLDSATELFGDTTGAANAARGRALALANADLRTAYLADDSMFDGLLAAVQAAYTTYHGDRSGPNATAVIVAIEDLYAGLGWERTVHLDVRVFGPRKLFPFGKYQNSAVPPVTDTPAIVSILHSVFDLSSAYLAEFQGFTVPADRAALDAAISSTGATPPSAV